METSITKPRVPYYGHWEHLPIRFTITEAWIFSAKREWKPLHPAEANCNGRPLGTRYMGASDEELFKKWFGDLPPLPPEAFKEPIILMEDVVRPRLPSTPG